VIAAGPELVDADGAVDMKFGRWPAIYGQPRITGRRLDPGVPPPPADIPDRYPFRLSVDQLERSRIERWCYLAGRKATWIWTATPGAEKPKMSVVL
jgi:hypothetical protein